MKEAIVSAGPKVNIVDSPISNPKADQVLIKVVYSGFAHPVQHKVSSVRLTIFLNRPQGLEVSNMAPNHMSSGDDIAGYIEEVGENVTEFKKGDRVAAFHEMLSPYGSFTEHAIAWDYSTFHLPKHISFEEAATIPFTAMSAAVGLYSMLGLPISMHPASEPTPLIFYGASGAVSAFAVKLAQASDIHPIIAVAGKGKAFVETLISRDRGDAIVDYRESDAVVVSGIQEAFKSAGVKEVKYVFDGASEKGNCQNVCQTLASQGSKISLILFNNKCEDIPSNIEWNNMKVGSVHGKFGYEKKEEPKKVKAGKDFGFLFFRWFSQRLREGSFSDHPYEIVQGGLNGVEKGLSDLKAGKASAVKYIYNIEDTQ